MQEEIQLKTNDGHVIYGTLDSSEEKSETLLIFVHGFTGNRNEHQYFNAASFFTEKGFNTFRFDFYGAKTNARQLKDISLQEHFSDLNLVINFFKNKYKDIVLIGHSLGGVVVLNVDLSYISKIVLRLARTVLASLRKE